MLKLISKLEDLPLLFIRLLLAYGFYSPAMMKLKDINSVAEWFKSINIPFPLLNAYLAAGTEIAGVVLLTLGFFTRLISIPLMVTMVVAILTVHLVNGFNSSDNGFEIPLYYLLMLFTLTIFGAGKLSLDNLVFKNKL